MDQQLRRSDLVRPMTERDLMQVLQWRNHWDVRRYMFTQHEILPDEHRNWFDIAIRDASRHLLIFENNEKALGFISFHVVALGAIADWGFYAAPEAPKGTGRMLGRAAVQYAFSQFSLYKICGRVLANNEASIRFHQALGFKQEGVLRCQHFDGQVYHNVSCFGLLADEWSMPG